MHEIFREDHAPLPLKPENRLAEVVIGLVLVSALPVLLRYLAA